MHRRSSTLVLLLGSAPLAAQVQLPAAIDAREALRRPPPLANPLFRADYLAHDVRANQDGIASVDFDGDGDLDVLFASSSPPELRALVNNGRGCSSIIGARRSRSRRTVSRWATSTGTGSPMWPSRRGSART